MAQDKVNRYLENRKKRLSEESTQASNAASFSGAAGSADTVSDYLKRREERISGSGYEQKLRQRDVAVWEKTQKNRQSAWDEQIAREERERKADALRENAGSFEAQRDYSMDRMRSLVDRESRTAADNKGALERIRQNVAQTAGLPEPEKALPSFKRHDLSGNASFRQAEATDEYNPYEDAMAALKQRMAEQQAQKMRQEHLDRTRLIPRLTESNQLLGGTFKADEYAGPQLDIERRLTEDMPEGNIARSLNDAPEIAKVPLDAQAIGQRIAIDKIKADEEAAAAFEAENPKPEEEATGLDWGSWADASLKKGWTRIGGQTAQTINAMLEPAQALGADLGAKYMKHRLGEQYADVIDYNANQVKEKPAIGPVYDWAVDPMQQAEEYSAAVNKDGGYMAEIGSEVIANAVTQVPNLIVALMSGGASAATDAFARAQTSFGGAVMQSAKKMASSPNFALSFSQMYGGRYEDATADGASPYRAALTATITTLLNSMVEMGGGVENLPFTKATVGDWVKGALDEGKEEVIQQVIDQMGQKALVNKNVPWFSMEDESAVINPKVLGENALVGALAGGLIGGPGMIVNNAINAHAQGERFDAAPDMSDTAIQLAQEQNRMNLTDEAQRYAPVTQTDIQQAAETDRYGARIEATARLAQEVADAEIAEEQALAVKPAQTGAQETTEAAQSAPVQTPARRETAAQPAQDHRADIREAAQRIQDEAQKRQFVQTAEKYGEAALVFASNYEGGDIAAYDRGFNALYSAGKVNLSMDRVGEAADALTAGMTEAKKAAIWQAGRNAEAATITPGVKQMTTVHLSGMQRRQFKMLNEIGRRYNVEIDIVDSIGSGAINAAYTGGRRITVAADAAHGAIVQAGVHELVHMLRTTDAGGYSVLSEVVLGHLGKSGDFDMEYAIGERLKQYGWTEARRDDAIEEIVAEAVPTFLTDADAVRAFVKRDKTLAQKVRDFFVNFAEEIREIATKYAFGGSSNEYDANRYEIVELLGKSDALTEIAETFDRALEAAGEKEAAPDGETVLARNEGERNSRYLISEGNRGEVAAEEEKALTNTGIYVSADDEIAYPAVQETMHSLRTLPETDYIKERDKAAAALAKKMGIEAKDAQRYIDNLTGVAAIIAADQARLDYEHESAYSAIKHNSEYKWTVDFSTLCKKRLLYTGTFDAIQSKLHDTVLTEDDYIRLRDMMAKKGYEVACAFCYVESRRKNNGEIISKFLDIYRNAEKSGGVMELGPANRRKTFKVEKGFSPNIADFNTSEGIANILHNHRDVYDAYMYFMNARGVSKPKLIESRTDYTNEILSKFKSASAVRAMNRRGGLRLQSFSDFEVINLLDMMQVVTDMARVGLMSQAYTKVPAFARVFGGTGVKINLSLVTKGVDKNGKLIFDDVEGMPHEEAFRIREMYSENVGTILVGRDDATIRAAMNDPRIDFIIPYHASGWSTENQAALGIAGYTNYTMGQNETSIATGKGVKNYYPAEYWDYSKSGDENAAAYLQKCAESGRTPKFPQFAGESGYWKMLIDFKMYDNEGKGAPQRAVRPDVNMTEAKKVLDEYKGGHVKLPVAQDIVDEFLAEYREAHPESETRFSLNNTATIESVMVDDQNLMLPADVDVRVESIRGVAASALSRGISERMDQQITGIANKILRETGSTYNKADFIANMRALIDEYAENGATEDTLRAVAEMAKKIIESSSRADNTLREQYADIRKKLRETGISLTDTQKQEAANEAGSYDAWRKSLMGTVKIGNEGISLDAIWAELSEQHPEIFPPDTGEAEMTGKLTDFMLLMKPKYENPYGMDMDGAALEMAMRIQGDIMGILGAKDAAKDMYGTAEKFRAQYEAEFKARLAQQKKERVDKFRRIASDLRAAKAAGNTREQALVMSRYRAAVKATALDEAFAEVRATYKEREAQRAENRKANEMRGRVVQRASKLMKMLEGRDKKKRIPTGLQEMVIDALKMLDINGERAASTGRETQKAAAFRQKLDAIGQFYREVWDRQSRGETPDGMDGLMMSFTERNLAAMNEALEIIGAGDRFTLREMNSEQLRMLDELLKNIDHTVASIGKLWRMHRYGSVVEMGDASIAEMDERKEQRLDADSLGGMGRDFLGLDMLEPVSFGERLGKTGRAIMQMLLDGEKDKFSRIREAVDATRRMMADAEINGYDIGKWRKQVYTITLGSGKVIKMSAVNVMELYLTAKRPQGLQHLLANGMKVMGKEAGQQPRHVILTQADITNISDMLTEKQRKIADMMQKYLSGDVAKWGNDITQRLYLYDAFTEDAYWPISSDPNSLKTQEPEADRAFTAITNAGFTKPLNVKATNPIIIGDAFETFDRHVVEMASYAGYAEAMTDVLAWLNYKQRSDGLITGSVKESIEVLLGKRGAKYLTKLVQDINGARRGGDAVQLGRLMGNYKRAAVMGKIRVAIQQPMSIVRAAAEMSPVYLLAGMTAKRSDIAEMQKWSALAWWKANGNYEIGIGRSTDQIFWGDTNRVDTAVDTAARVGALGLDPGKVDDWAWSKLWNATKREISRTRPELAEGSDAYFEAVTKRFESIVDRTQVVDTVMHRSDLMRSKDGMAKVLTSFMGEPTKSYNMLARAIMDLWRNPKSTDAMRRLTVTASAYTASAAATAAATAMFDAFKNRSDDDDLWTYLTEGGLADDWTRRFLVNFGSNVNPVMNIPVLSDAIASFTDREAPTMMGFEGIVDLRYSLDKLKNYLFEGNTKKLTAYGAFAPAAKAASSLTGLPINGLLANAEMLVHVFDPKLMQAKSDMGKTEDAYAALYKAIAAGDTKKARSIRTQLTNGMYGKTPKSPKEIDKGVAEALAANDERVMQAYELRTKGNRTKDVLSIKSQIMADGFTDAQVTAAINYCETLTETEAVEKDMNAQLTAKLFDSEDLETAIRSGSVYDVSEITEYLVNTSTAKDPEKSVRSNVSGEAKAEYLRLFNAGMQTQADALARKLKVIGFDDDDFAGWVRDARYDELYDAVGGGNASEARDVIETLVESGAEVDSIVSRLNSRYRDEYVAYVQSGQTAKAAELARTLQGLKLYWKDGKTNYYRDDKLAEWLE